MRASCLGGKPDGAMKVKAGEVRAIRVCESLPSPGGASHRDRSQVTLWPVSSESVPVATRKMVNYA